MNKVSVLILLAMSMLLSACIVPYHEHGGHHQKRDHHAHPGNSAFGHSQGNGRGPHR